MSTRSSRSKEPAKGTLEVTPEEGKIENVEISPKPKAPKPAILEVDTTPVEPVVAEEAVAAEKIQTDVREKLSNRNLEENVFVPSNPAALEKAALQISQEMGFEFNRGTSVGARLLARAQQNKAR